MSFMQARLLGLLGVNAVILAWAVLLVEELVQDARQKLGCNRRSGAAVGNVWNGLHIFVGTARIAEVCPVLSVCGRARWLLLLAVLVWSGRRALVARFPACSHRPISGRNRRRPDSSPGINA